MMGLDELIEAIVSGVDERAEPAALALAGYGPEAAAALAARLPSASTDGRWWIARALAVVPGAEAARLLVELMEDPATDVRTCAAFALGELGEAAGAEGANALAVHLADDSAHVAEVCSVALGRMGATAVPALLHALQQGKAGERIRAAKALVPIESHDAIPALIQALDDEEALVEYYAEDALARMGVGMVLLKP